MAGPPTDPPLWNPDSGQEITPEQKQLARDLVLAGLRRGAELPPAEGAAQRGEPGPPQPTAPEPPAELQVVYDLEGPESPSADGC